MNANLFPLLRCPACLETRLSHVTRRAVGELVMEGEVRCLTCARVYPITDGILDAWSALAQPSDSPRPLQQTGQWLMEQPWLSRTYERLVRPLLMSVAGSPRWLRVERDFLARAHAVAPDDVLLDAACGPGRWTRLLAERTRARQVVGIDISASMLDQCNRRNREEGLAQRISLVRADVTRLPFVDRAFGGANCFTAFHLFPSPDTAVAELARVVKAGRRLTVMLLTQPEQSWRTPLARLFEKAGQMRFAPAEELRRTLWRHRIATVDEVDAGMAVLLAGVVAEARRSVAVLP